MYCNKYSKNVWTGSEGVSDVYMYIFQLWLLMIFFNLLIYTCTDILFLLVDVNWF